MPWNFTFTHANASELYIKIYLIRAYNMYKLNEWETNTIVQNCNQRTFIYLFTKLITYIQCLFIILLLSANPLENYTIANYCTIQVVDLSASLTFLTTVLVRKCDQNSPENCKVLLLFVHSFMYKSNLFNSLFVFTFTGEKEMIAAGFRSLRKTFIKNC